MSHLNPEEIIKKYFDAVWQKRDPSIVDEIYHKDAVLFGNTGLFEGSEDIKKAYKSWLNILYKINTERLDIATSGNEVMVQWDTTATKIGKVPQLHVKGKDVFLTGMDHFRFREGLIEMQWSFLRYFAADENPYVNIDFP